MPCVFLFWSEEARVVNTRQVIGCHGGLRQAVSTCAGLAYNGVVLLRLAEKREADMKRIPVLLLFTLLMPVALAACGGPSPVLEDEASPVVAESPGTPDRSADVTATVFAANAQATFDALPVATATRPAPSATPTEAAIALTLAALATQQAPTLVAGQTLAAQTQAALPSPTPLVFDLSSDAGNATSLSNAWSVVYAAPDGFPFTINADEETLALAIQNAMVAAGYGENVSGLSVRLSNNLVTLSMALTIAGVSGEGRIGFSVFAQSGEAIVTLRSLQFDRFTVPPDLLTALTVALSEAFSGASDPGQAEVTIDGIFVDDGVLIISGTVGTPA